MKGCQKFEMMTPDLWRFEPKINSLRRGQPIY